jgi:hypothetical protein
MANQREYTMLKRVRSQVIQLTPDQAVFWSAVGCGLVCLLLM